MIILLTWYFELEIYMAALVGKQKQVWYNGGRYRNSCTGCFAIRLCPAEMNCREAIWNDLNFQRNEGTEYEKEH